MRKTQVIKRNNNKNVDNKFSSQMRFWNNNQKGERSNSSKEFGSNYNNNLNEFGQSYIMNQL